jgi:hypothetical protein
MSAAGQGVRDEEALKRGMGEGVNFNSVHATANLHFVELSGFEQST